MDEDPHAFRPGILTRIGLGLTGGNPERARWAGRDDQARFVVLALALACLFAWVGLNMAHALHIATGEEMTAPRTLVLSGLIAGMYALVDLALMQARWWTLGRNLAGERGFGPRQGAGATAIGAIAALPFGLIRLALAVAVAMFTAGSFALWWWSADIASQVAAGNAAANSPIRQRIEAELDLDLASRTAELRQTETRIADRAAARQRQTSQLAEAAASTRTGLQARLDDLNSRLFTAEERLACARRDAVAERDGLTTCDGRVVTDAGNGPLYLAAVAEQALSEQEIGRMAAERARIEAILAGLPRAGEIAAGADPEAVRRDELRAERSAMLAGRAAVVAGRLAADPAFVAPADGMLIRQKALIALAAREPAVLAQIAIVLSMFVLIDLAVLAIALGRQGASIYALRLAVEFETRAAAEIARGQAAMAEAATAGMQAQIAQLHAQVQLARTERALRDELRQMELAAGALDQWAAEMIARTDRTPPHFDA